MKPQLNDRNVTNTVVGDTQTFTIAASAHAFRVLVDSLYSDKILSVVRELCTNAFDGHARRRNRNEPFEVLLPSTYAPTFAVRDYGSGMDHEFVMRLYSRLFHSDKQSTNTEVGMLGLGSKSPFAYTDSFTVKVHEPTGHMRTYVVAVAADGIPAITYLGTSFTGEPEGTEISFAVNQRDYVAFASAVRQIADGFDVRPKFMGDPGPKVWSLETGNIKARRGTGYNDQAITIRQGCVIYPVPTSIKRPDIPSGWCLQIDVPIGTVNVTASREALELNLQTTAALNKAVTGANVVLGAHITALIGEAKDDYERAVLGEELRRWPGCPRLPETLSVSAAYGLSIETFTDKWKVDMAAKIPNGVGTNSEHSVNGWVPFEVFVTRQKSLQALWDVPARILPNLIIVRDCGEKIQRRQLRLKAWQQVHSSGVIFRGTDAQFRAVCTYFHVTPDRCSNITDIPDVKLAPRKARTCGGTPAQTAATVTEPWLPRIGKYWQFPALTKAGAGESELPRDVARAAGFVSLQKPAVLLTPSQTAKMTDVNQRWDNLLVAALRAVPDSKVDPVALFCVLLNMLGNSYSTARIGVPGAAETARNLVSAEYKYTVSDAEAQGFVCATILGFYTDNVEKAKATRKQLLAKYPMLFAPSPSNIAEYVADRDKLNLTLSPST